MTESGGSARGEDLGGAWRPGGDEPTGLKDRVLRMASGYTRTQKIVGGAAILGVVFGVMMVSRLTGGGDWAPLYTEVTADDGGAIVAALEEQGVPHQLAAGGSTIMVPADAVYETRLALSDTALPSEGKVGYGVLDSQGLTTSEFGQRVGYQRAMEGELAATIKALDPVETAVVHLALPADEVFALDEEEPSASVLVRTRPGQTLTDDQVRAVTNLVSSSIEGMTPEAVTVADADGNVLAAPGQGVTGGGGDGQRQEQTAEFEAGVQASLESMLVGVVGLDGAKVTVSADLDFDESNTSRETFEAPAANAAGEDLALEESTREETFTGSNPAAAGVLGPDTPELPAGGDSDYSLDEADVRFALNRIVESTNTAPGAIERLSVAVLVDEEMIGAEQTVDLSEALSAGAGVVEDRGDVLTVTRLPFDRTAAQSAQAELEAAEAAEAAAARGDTVRDVIVVVVLALLLIVAFVSYRLADRRRRRQDDELIAAFTAPHELPPAPTSLVEQADDADVLELSGTDDEFEVLDAAVTGDETDMVLAPAMSQHAALLADDRDRGGRESHLTQLIEHQPDEVAALLRNWLGDRRGASR